MVSWDPTSLSISFATNGENRRYFSDVYPPTHTHTHTHTGHLCDEEVTSSGADLKTSAVHFLDALCAPVTTDYRTVCFWIRWQWRCPCRRELLRQLSRSMFPRCPCTDASDGCLQQQSSEESDPQRSHDRRRWQSNSCLQRRQSSPIHSNCCRLTKLSWVLSNPLDSSHFVFTFCIHIQCLHILSSHSVSNFRFRVTISIQKNHIL